jgi:hypothetical protein
MTQEIDAQIVGHCRGIIDGDTSSIDPLADRMRELNYDQKAWQWVRGRKRLLANVKFQMLILACTSSICNQLAVIFATRSVRVWEEWASENVLAKALPRFLLLGMRAGWIDGSVPTANYLTLLPSVSEFYRASVRPVPNDEYSCRVRFAAIACVNTYGLRYVGGDSDAEPQCDLYLTGFQLLWIATCARDALPESEREAEYQWQFSQLAELFY